MCSLYSSGNRWLEIKRRQKKFYSRIKRLYIGRPSMKHLVAGDIRLKQHVLKCVFKKAITARVTYTTSQQHITKRSYSAATGVSFV